LIRRFWYSACCAALLGFSAPATLQSAGSGVAAPDPDLTRYLVAAARANDAIDVSVLRRGLVFGRDGKHAEAAAAFARAAKEMPGLADWAYILAAEAASRMGDTALVRAHLAATEPALARDWGWRARVRALRVAGDTTAALAAARAATRSISDSTRLAAAHLFVAEIFLGSGDTVRAVASLREVLRRPASAAGLDAAQRMRGLRTSDPTDAYNVAQAFLRHGRYDALEVVLDSSALRNASVRASAGALRAEFAGRLFAQRRYDAVLRVGARLIADTAASAEARAEAQLLRGRSLLRQGKNTEAVAAFRTVVSQFPRQSAAGHAAFIIADLRHDEALDEEAVEHYGAASSAATGGSAIEAAVRLAGAQAVRGAFAPAAQLIETQRVSASGPDAARLNYLAGQLYDRAGDTATARARWRDVITADPVSYYAFRAYERLGTKPSLPAGPLTPDSMQRRASGAARRLDLLRTLDLAEIAAFEMTRVRQYFGRESSAMYSLAEAMHAGGDHFRGISIGREIQRSQPAMDRRLLRILYPFPYRETIVAEAKRVGVDPYFAAALIRQESMFNPRARSVAGAVGLMQLMPATARKLAPRAGVGRYRAARLTEVNYNLKLGMLHLADLLKEERGRVPDVLAGYNAGATPLARWRRFPEYAEPDWFTERIPYAETRDYVRIVQQNARIYEMLYSAREQPARAGSGR